MIDIGNILWSLIPPKIEPRFIGDLPAVATEGTTCLVYSSNASTQFFGMNTSIYRPLAKFVTRTSKYTEGVETMDLISKSLRDYVGDDVVIGVNQVGSPIYLGRNSEKLHEFQITFEILTKE